MLSFVRSPSSSMDTSEGLKIQDLSFEQALIEAKRNSVQGGSSYPVELEPVELELIEDDLVPIDPGFGGPVTGVRRDPVTGRFVIVPQRFPILGFNAGRSSFGGQSLF